MPRPERSSRDAIVVFAKRPAPGKVKTRLRPALSPSQAADLYSCFLEDTLDRVRGLAAERYLAYHPPGAVGFFRSLGRRSGFRPIRQTGRDLAGRMRGVIERLFVSGVDRVVAIGSDSPTLPLGIVRQAFQFLGALGRDVVLSPGSDGGYVLVGLARSATAAVLRGEMSTSGVLDRTIERARRLGLKVGILPSWYDVDVPADLARLAAETTGPRRTGGGWVARRTRAYLSCHPDLASACAGAP